MSQAIFDAMTAKQQRDLTLFAENVAKQNQSVNLIAQSTVEAIWQRHIFDSLQLVPHVLAAVAQNETASVLDMGTGGGLPAVPLAVAFSQTCNILVHALDSDQKKIAAVRLMTLGLDVNLQLHCQRVESHRLKHAVVVSRALAALGTLIAWSQPCLKPDGKLIVLKGERFAEEIRAAAEKWHFSTATHPSVTNPSAAILVVSDISPRHP